MFVDTSGMHELHNRKIEILEIDPLAHENNGLIASMKILAGE